MHIQLTTTGICHICFRSICFLRCNSVKCDHQDHVKNIINFTRLKYSNQKVIFYANFLDCHFRCVWMIPSLKRKNRLFRQTQSVNFICLHLQTESKIFRLLDCLRLCSAFFFRTAFFRLVRFYDTAFKCMQLVWSWERQSKCRKKIHNHSNKLWSAYFAYITTVFPAFFRLKNPSKICIYCMSSSSLVFREEIFTCILTWSYISPPYFFFSCMSFRLINFYLFVHILISSVWTVLKSTRPNETRTKPLNWW